MKIEEYVDVSGCVTFRSWFDALNEQAADRVNRALYKLEQGNYSNVKGVGGGVLEFKIDFGPGYRIYFGRDGESLIILLFGGSKKCKSKDIKFAKLKWHEYKQRKKRG